MVILLVHPFLYRWMRLPLHIATENFFFQPVLFLKNPFIATTLILSLGASLFYHINWKSLPINRFESRFILVVLSCLVWNYLFYDFNFYYNQWHGFDRVFLGVMCMLAFRYPLLIIPALMQINLLHHQFDFPIGTFSFLQMSMPYEVVAISASFILVSSFNKICVQKKDLNEPKKPDVLVYLFLIVAASCYYHSGIQKILISPHGWEWPFTNQITNNLMAFYHRGWLATLPNANASLFSFFAHTEIPGQCIILLGELAFIFLLFSKRTSVWILVVMLFLHVSVLVTNGGFFWIWMIADIGLIYLLKTGDYSLNLKTGLLGIVCIQLSVFIIQAPRLGWYDSPLDDRFELVANNDIDLSEASVAPYTWHFQHGNFLAVLNRRTLTAGFPVTDYSLLKSIEMTDSAGIEQLIEVKGQNRFQMERFLGMQRLLSRLMENQKNNPLKFLQPPNYWNAHLFSTKKVMAGPELDSIALYNRVDLNKGLECIIVRRSLVLQVIRSK